MKARDLVLSALFASLWATSQYSLGPLVGRFSLGPISFHGSVNRLVGWSCMTILSLLTNAFGPISLMSAVAATVTRPLRVQQLESLFVGLGYFSGGLTYDVLMLRDRNCTRWHLIVALVSGLVASTPYMFLKLYFLGLEGFIAYFFFIYSLQVAKSTLFSIVGTSVGLTLVKSYRLLSSPQDAHLTKKVS